MPFSLRALRHTVALLTASGLLLTAIGLGASLDGIPVSAGPVLKFRVPESAVVDSRGRVFVADAGGRRLVAADRDGSLRWQRQASAAPEGFSRLVSVCIDTGGRLYAFDGGRNRVVRLRADGTLDLVLFAPLTGRIESFDVFLSGGWAVVREGPLLRTYQIALDGTSRAPVRELPAGPDLLRTSASPWGEAAAVDAEGQLWRSDPAAGWQKTADPPGHRITAARYLADGSLLCLDGADRSWWVRSPLATEFRLLRGPPASGGDWSPLPSAGPDGRLVFCDPLGGRVQIDGGAWAADSLTGAQLSLWDRLRPWLGWILIAAGVVLLTAGFTAAARRLLRRAFDVQVLSLIVLIPAAFLLTMGWQHGSFEAFAADLADHRTESLAEGAAAAVGELEGAPDLEAALTRIHQRGVLSGSYDRVRLLELREGSVRVVGARPEFWTAGSSAAGLPDRTPGTEGLRGLVTYEDPESLRQSHFRDLSSGLVLEVGRDLEPSSVTDLPTSRTLHFLALGVTAVYLGGLGALGWALLAVSAPRHRLARTLTARGRTGADALRAFFPRTAREWASGRGSDHGTVIGIAWGPPAQAREAFQQALARKIGELGLFVRSEGGLVTDVRPEGLLVLTPGSRDEGLSLARELASRWKPFRTALDAGPWTWETWRFADRLDLRPTGDPVRRVRALLEWQPDLPLGLVSRSGYLAECPEVPWRPVGTESGEAVGQILDPADPDHAVLLDYLTPFRAAFDAWAAGRSDEARDRLAFLLTRLPDDPALLRLADEVLK